MDFLCEFKNRGPKWPNANNEGNLYRTGGCKMKTFLPFLKYHRITYNYPNHRVKGNITSDVAKAGHMGSIKLFFCPWSELYLMFFFKKTPLKDLLVLKMRKNMKNIFAIFLCGPRPYLSLHLARMQKSLITPVFIRLFDVLNVLLFKIKILLSRFIYANNTKKYTSFSLSFLIGNILLMDHFSLLIFQVGPRIIVHCWKCFMSLELMNTQPRNI
jgi:hypothetical protein